MASLQTCVVVEQINNDFVVISWNILHMIHEINHAYDTSPVIVHYSIDEKWSNETFRLNDIIKTLFDLLKKYSHMEAFICLQEVPGDLLPLLDQMFDLHFDSLFVHKPIVHVHTYSRKPHVRRKHQDLLYMDSSESLVTIHYNPNIINSTNQANQLNDVNESLLSEDKIIWTSCPTDGGKGALTLITPSGLTIVNVHIPYENQAAYLLLKNIQWPENNNRFVFVGDINRDSASIMKMIDEMTIDKPNLDLLFPITTDKPTRIGLHQNGSRTKKWIDHYVVSSSLRKLAQSPALVYDQIGSISDHYPIILHFKNI